MHSISTEKAPAAIGPYSQGVVVNGLLFASGQIALSPETGELVGSTIEEQAEQVMKNVGALLTAAGTDFSCPCSPTCTPVAAWSPCHTLPRYYNTVPVKPQTI